MNKKMCLYGVLGIGAFALIAVSLCAVFYAGKYYAADGYRHHAVGKYHAYWMSEKKLNKLARKLDLTDAQRATLFSLADEAKPTVEEIREQMHALWRALLELDPNAEGYDAKVAELAAQHSELARRMTIMLAGMKTTLADAFTEPQMQKFMDLLARRHRH